MVCQLRDSTDYTYSVKRYDILMSGVFQPLGLYPTCTLPSVCHAGCATCVATFPALLIAV